MLCDIPSNIAESYSQSESAFQVPYAWSYGTCSVGLHIISHDPAAAVSVPMDSITDVALDLIRDCVVDTMSPQLGGRSEVIAGRPLWVFVLGLEEVRATSPPEPHTCAYPRVPP